MWILAGIFGDMSVIEEVVFFGFEDFLCVVVFGEGLVVLVWVVVWMLDCCVVEEGVLNIGFVFEEELLL